MEKLKNLLFMILFLVFSFLAIGIRFIVSPDSSQAKNNKVTIRAVSLGAVVLCPTTISSNGTAFDSVAASAKLRVSAATSVDVVKGTVARVELSETDNPNSFAYTVTGGNVANSSGK